MNNSGLVDFVLFDLRKLKGLPNPYTAIWTELHSIAFVLLVGGLLQSLWVNRENKDHGLPSVLRAAVLTGMIAMLPFLRDLVLNIFYYFPEKLLGNMASSSSSGLNAAGDDILKSLQAKSPFSSTASILTSPMEYFGGVIIYTVFRVIALVAGFIAIPFYFSQAYLEQLTFAMLPIALGVMGIPALKERATTFVMFYLSVLAWPLGFVAATLGAQQVFEIAANPPQQSFIYSFAVPFVASTVLIAGIAMTPVIMFYTFAYGASAVSPVSIGQIASTFNQTAGRLAMMRGK